MRRNSNNNNSRTHLPASAASLAVVCRFGMGLHGRQYPRSLRPGWGAELEFGPAHFHSRLDEDDDDFYGSRSVQVVAVDVAGAPVFWVVWCSWLGPGQKAIAKAVWMQRSERRRSESAAGCGSAVGQGRKAILHEINRQCVEKHPIVPLWWDWGCSGWGVKIYIFNILFNSIRNL